MEIQTTITSPPTFGPNACPVYLRLPYMGVKSKTLAKQVSHAIESTFNSVVLRVVYNTKRPLAGIVKDAIPPHELSNTVYVCSNHYIGRAYQRFHVKRDQHVIKKL